MTVPYQNHAVILVLWLPGSSAATAVVSRCWRQSCEESCHRRTIPEASPPLLLPLVKPPVFTLMIRFAICFHTCFSNSFSLIPVVFSPPFPSIFLSGSPIAGPLVQLCASDYMALDSQHKQLLVSSLLVYWSFWLNIQCRVCMGICLSVYLGPGHEDKIARLKIYLIVLFPSRSDLTFTVLKSTQYCMISWWVARVCAFAYAAHALLGALLLL